MTKLQSLKASQAVSQAARLVTLAQLGRQVVQTSQLLVSQPSWHDQVAASLPDTANSRTARQMAHTGLILVVVLRVL